MTVKMIAAKRFRLVQEKGFVWIDTGQPYDVPSEKTADYHEKSGRGKRVAETRPASKAKE